MLHYTWNPTRKRATVDAVNVVLKELIQATTALYQNELKNISTTQLNLFKSIVKGEVQFTSTSVMEKYVLGTPRNVSKNKTQLINSDIIHKVNGMYEFVNPAFEYWFKKQFLNQSYLL